MSAGKETIEEKQTILLKYMQRFRCPILRDDQEMTWKVGVCNRPQKQEDAVFLAPIIVLK